MPRLLKTVLLYLLMLTIPAQGFAASTMLYCGSANQHMTAQETARHSAYSDTKSLVADHRHQGAVSLDTADHALSDTAVNFASSDQDLERGGELGAHEGGEHAACSSVGAAISAFSAQFTPAEQAIERFASNQFVDTGYVTDGPRRPPRSLPA